MTDSPRGNTLFLAGAIAVAALAIGAGLFVLGSPSTVRAKRLDVDRINDLRSIAGSLGHYWSEHRRLPASLEDPTFVSPWATLALKDPETSRPYTYRPGGGPTYTLCAIFERENLAGDPRWTHPAGEHCFTFQAGVPDPSRR